MLKNLKAKEVIKILESFGFSVFSQKGSHVKLRRVGILGKQTLVVPNHDPIAKGTLRDIFNQASQYISSEHLVEHFFTK